MSSDQRRQSAACTTCSTVYVRLGFLACSSTLAADQMMSIIVNYVVSGSWFEVKDDGTVRDSNAISYFPLLFSFNDVVVIFTSDGSCDSQK